ncbi:MAG: hypothetical protein ACXVP0_12845 [Bacteroidia bacterium]
MTLTIHSGMKISALQKQFNTVFPFLKLEFFKHRHQAHVGSTKKDHIEPHGTLKHLQKGRAKQKIEITNDMTVTTLEQIFATDFGLSVQVFRKSGNLWLETTVTDDWTLKKQNDQGCELSRLKTGTSM